MEEDDGCLYRGVLQNLIRGIVGVDYSSRGAVKVRSGAEAGASAKDVKSSSLVKSFF